MNKTIKVIASGGLGDCLLVTPFVRYFKTHFPESRLVVHTYPAAKRIFENNSHVDEIICTAPEHLAFLALPESDCEVFAPFMQFESIKVDSSSGETHAKSVQMLKANLQNKSVILQIAKKFGLTLDSIDMEFNIRPEEKEQASFFFNRDSNKKNILVNNSSPLSEKLIPDNLWRDLCNELSESYNVFEMTPTASLQEKVVHLNPLPEIGVSAAILEAVDCTLTIDTFTAHLCAAIKSPAVVIWGPSNHQAYGHSLNMNYQTDLCPPCANTSRLRSCRDRVCLKQIDINEIVALVKATVENRSVSAYRESRYV